MISFNKVPIKFETCCDGELGLAPCAAASGPEYWKKPVFKNRHQLNCEAAIHWIRKVEDHQHRLFITCDIAFRFLTEINAFDKGPNFYAKFLKLIPGPVLCTWLENSYSLEYFNRNLFNVWKAIPKADEQLFYEFAVFKAWDCLYLSNSYRENNKIYIDFVYRGMLEHCLIKYDTKILFKLIQICIDEDDITTTKIIFSFLDGKLSIILPQLNKYLQFCRLNKSNEWVELMIDNGANPCIPPPTHHIPIHTENYKAISTRNDDVETMRLMWYYSKKLEKRDAIMTSHQKPKSPFLDFILMELSKDKIGIKTIAHMRRVSRGLKERINDIVLTSTIFRWGFHSRPVEFQAFFHKGTVAERLNQIFLRKLNMNELQLRSNGEQLYQAKSKIVHLQFKFFVNNFHEIEFKLDLENKIFNLCEYCPCGYTALHYACIYKGTIDQIDLLLANGALMDQPGIDGSTALCSAIRAGRLDVVKHLLAKGANIHGVEWCKTPPLLYCYWPPIVLNLPSMHKMAQFLLDSGADIRSQDENGFTLLHLAIQEEDIELIKELVDKNYQIYDMLDDLTFKKLQDMLPESNIKR